MCRFIVYKGIEPILLSHLVTRPLHSIINQAFESRLRLPSSRPMNADGFGLGWYDALPPSQAAVNALSKTVTPTAPPHERDSQSSQVIRPPIATAHLQSHESVVMIDGDGHEEADEKAAVLKKLRHEERELEKERPCLFKSLSPAWSNANLTRLAEKICSPLVFAHVRASTMAGAPNEDNCHPWVFDKLMWMHNGQVCGVVFAIHTQLIGAQIIDFQKIKRALQMSLPEELFLYPSGYTDSEWAFMVFLSRLKDPHARSFTHVELRNAMMETILFINELCKDAGVTGSHLLNFVVSDGETVVATRYIASRTSEASSLFFSSGTSFDEYREGGLYRMTKADKRESVIMIASEPLTFERREWMEVKTNTMIVITPKMNLLQIPIIDEFWVAPQDPASYQRSKEFAISMGFGHGFASQLASSEVTA
ncbi:MAG: hypothetical protein TREMPRED_005293 [Tremellales sp. Tagirdzhanova-0007]|nr:MAG: hypothetical protein TREMPRED_005293 [Tremellales sp. Tagirdzhanova-0007]